MQTSEPSTATATTTVPGVWNGIERRRVERVVETLTTLGSRGESLSEVAHDARNMVTALALYCDLLEEPDVLTAGFAHYAQELRLVAAASRRLVEKLVTLDAGLSPEGRLQSLLDTSAARRAALAEAARDPTQESAAAGPVVGFTLDTLEAPETPFPSGTDRRGSAPARQHRTGRNHDRLERAQPACHPAAAAAEERTRRWDLLPALPVANLASELLANRNLLAALAGPSVALTIETDGGAQAVQLTGEDLTRLLVNLVKNAAEAMPGGGRIHLGLHEQEAVPGAATCLLLTVEDNGPGIPAESIGAIFTSGFTTRAQATTAGGWPRSHRGLGLAIVRSIVEGAGGRITAANRPQGGACFTLELPVRKTGTRDSDQGQRD